MVITNCVLEDDDDREDGPHGILAGEDVERLDVVEDGAQGERERHLEPVRHLSRVVGADPPRHPSDAHHPVPRRRRQREQPQARRRGEAGQAVHRRYQPREETTHHQCPAAAFGVLVFRRGGRHGHAPFWAAVVGVASGLVSCCSCHALCSI